MKNARGLRQAALYARDVPGVFIPHCEDGDLRGDAVMNEGARSFDLGLTGAPGLAEVHVARDILIGGDMKKPFHIAHLSTTMSADSRASAARKASRQRAKSRLTISCTSMTTYGICRRRFRSSPGNSSAVRN